MASASPINVVTLRNSSPVLFARVEDSDGNAITQASVSTITYSAYLLDKDWPADRDNRTSVTGHQAVPVVVSSSVYDSLQADDDRWTKDATGYNFAHQIDVSSNACFSVAGRRYLVEYTITPTSGQAVVVQYVVRVF